MRKKPSWDQRRQRELAWMLYITEGYIANMEHAMRINCVTFNDADTKEAMFGIAKAEATSHRLRTHLNRIAVTPRKELS